MDVPSTLLITNDFPPDVGGIQRMLSALLNELPPDRVRVIAPDRDGAAAFDAEQPYGIFRESSRFLWPSDRLLKRIVKVVDESNIEVVVFGAASPLAMLGPRLADEGIPYLVIAHGFEFWLSLLPGSHSLMRYATAKAGRVTTCSAFIGRTVRTAVPPQVPVSVFPPGADIDRFRPDLPTDDLRERHGLVGRPLVVCVSRLVRRKGQDVLISAMADVQDAVPNAALLIVGDGSDAPRLRELAKDAPIGSVVFAGEVSEGDLPRYYAMGDVFAMPCRSRLAGLEVEGWGAVFVEAAACGKPVIVGDSGGAREALVDGQTGLLVDGRDVGDVSGAVIELLRDRDLAARMGRAGRARVEREFSWPHLAMRMGGWLRTAAG